MCELSPLVLLGAPRYYTVPCSTGAGVNLFKKWIPGELFISSTTTLSGERTGPRMFYYAAYCRWMDVICDRQQFSVVYHFSRRWRLISPFSVEEYVCTGTCRIKIYRDHLKNLQACFKTKYEMWYKWRNVSLVRVGGTAQHLLFSWGNEKCFTSLPSSIWVSTVHIRQVNFSCPFAGWCLDQEYCEVVF